MPLIFGAGLAAAGSLAVTAYNLKQQWHFSKRAKGLKKTQVIRADKARYSAKDIEEAKEHLHIKQDAYSEENFPDISDEGREALMTAIKGLNAAMDKCAEDLNTTAHAQGRVMAFRNIAVPEAKKILDKHKETLSGAEKLAFEAATKDLFSKINTRQETLLEALTGDRKLQSRESVAPKWMLKARAYPSEKYPKGKKLKTSKDSNFQNNPEKMLKDNPSGIHFEIKRSKGHTMGITFTRSPSGSFDIGMRLPSKDKMTTRDRIEFARALVDGAKHVGLTELTINSGDKKWLREVYRQCQKQGIEFNPHPSVKTEYGIKMKSIARSRNWLLRKIPKTDAWAAHKAYSQGENLKSMAEKTRFKDKTKTTVEDSKSNRCKEWEKAYKSEVSEIFGHKKLEDGHAAASGKNRRVDEDKSNKNKPANNDDNPDSNASDVSLDDNSSQKSDASLDDASSQKQAAKSKAKPSKSEDAAKAKRKREDEPDAGTDVDEDHETGIQISPK